MKLKKYKLLVTNLIVLFFTYSITCHADNLNDEQTYLKFAIPVKFDTFDPTKSINAHTKLTLPLMYEPLVTINAEQSLKPVLAESWLISTDNHSVTITIKKNHYFSDHTEVTADDVVSSISRACAPISDVSEELKSLINCDKSHQNQNFKPSVVAIDKYNVQFNIKSSPATFLYQLSSPAAVVSKIAASGKLIGSGPYMIAHNDHSSLTLKKNPFSANDNSAINDGLILSYLNMKITPLSLIEGKFDGALMYKMDDIYDFKNDKYRLYKITPNITETLVLNNQKYPFDHAIVRRALSSAIYNTINCYCIPGAHKAYGFIPYGTGGSIANDSPVFLSIIPPEQVFQSVPELKRSKITVIIHQLEDQRNSCLEKQIRSTARPYNIDLKFYYHKNYPELESLYLHHKLDGFLELYVFRNREAYSTLRYFSQGGENNANVKDDTIDTILNHVMSTNTTHGRYQMYRNVNKYIQDQAIIIPILYMDHGNLLRKCIKGANDNFLFNPFIHLKQLTKSNMCHL